MRVLLLQDVQIQTINLLTFCSSWEPEYFAEMDFISPPKAEAHSFTLQIAHICTTGEQFIKEYVQYRFQLQAVNIVTSALCSFICDPDY